MLTPKHYQMQAVGSLRAYLRACRELGSPAAAFARVTAERSGAGGGYFSAPGFDGDLKEMPYVCLRLPTGGGKTLLACLCLPVMHRELLQQERSVVLWLVPSKAIQEQTLKALRDRDHPYRQALAAELGEVTVLEPAEALAVQRPVLDGTTTVIVSTLQAFRVGEELGRKVYESNGALLHHFQGLSAVQSAVLDRRDDGTVPYSLANVLRLRRPVVIVDEAHNARTPLSFEVLAKFRPSCILEFTATPAREESPSNVLHHVSARELQAEDMIKLPVRLETRTEWKRLLADAVAQREKLEREAAAEEAATGEHIRPILLLKCDRRDKRRETLTVDVVEKALLEDCRIPADQVRRATGDERGLEDLDLFARDCRVKFILTVDALREGWDCSFAYVLCSVADMHSAGAVEQLLGRVLRMPRAQRKKREALNRAYAFGCSTDFAATARALEDALVENGFNRMEARDLVVQPAVTQPNLDLPVRQAPPPRRLAVKEMPDTAGWSAELKQLVQVDVARGEVVLTTPLAPEHLDVVARSFVMDANRAAFVAEAESYAKEVETVGMSPAERGVRIAVPQFALESQGELRFLDPARFSHPEWNLLDYLKDAAEARFAVAEEQVRYGEIALTAEGKVRWRYAEELGVELEAAVEEANWSVTELVHWLDSNTEHDDVPVDQSAAFILALVERQLADGATLGRLVRRRFQLRVFVEQRIDDCRQLERSRAFQRILFDEKEGRVVVSEKAAMVFSHTGYPANWICERSGDFRKHFHREVGELKSEGEEFECALFLDQLPQVEVWVRNLGRQENASFSLPTATDKFYPDFVAKLTDGRILVVESKGKIYWSNDDSKEKRRLGELWARRSGGKCVFVMPEGKDFAAITKAVGG